MKSKLFPTMYALMVLTLLKPIPCPAQQEVAPDHFDNSSTPGIQQVPPLRKPSVAKGPRNFHGSFTLARDVSYAGLTLTPGTYSVALRSVGKQHWVTLMRDGSNASIQTHVASPDDAGRPIALMVEQQGEHRTLAGIRLQDPGMTLYFQVQPEEITSTEIKLIPISGVSRQ